MNFIETHTAPQGSSDATGKGDKKATESKEVKSESAGKEGPPDRLSGLHLDASQKAEDSTTKEVSESKEVKSGSAIKGDVSDRLSSLRLDSTIEEAAASEQS